MKCKKCGKDIGMANFCKFCGQKSEDSLNEEGSVDLYFKKRDNSCQSCGALVPLE